MRFLPRSGSQWNNHGTAMCPMAASGTNMIMIHFMAAKVSSNTGRCSRHFRKV